MKLYFTLFAISLSLLSFAQSSEPVKTVIVSCQYGELYIDGTLIGAMEADGARKRSVEPRRTLSST